MWELLFKSQNNNWDARINYAINFLPRMAARNLIRTFFDIMKSFLDQWSARICGEEMMTGMTGMTKDDWDD